MHSSLADVPQYSCGASFPLPHPSCDTGVLVKVAKAILDAIYEPGYQYAKAGVMLSDISASSYDQADLFSPAIDNEKSKKLMEPVDAINRGYPKSLYLASNGAKQGWQMAR